MYYPNRFHRRILEEYELEQTDSTKINVLDAISLVIPTWTPNVQQKTIENCFR